MENMEINKLSDMELVNNFRSGDQAAFSELLTRYSEKAHHLAMRISRNAEDAEEILQDVFVTVYKKIDKFEGKSAFSSWLYRITVNTSFMKLRKRKQNNCVSIDEMNSIDQENWTASRSDASDVNYLSARHELRSQLEAAIDKLPTDYRKIFMLRDVDGMSNEEVSVLLKLSIPAVKSRLHRSRLMLRRRLQSFYQDFSSESHISYGSTALQLEEVRLAA